MEVAPEAEDSTGEMACHQEQTTTPPPLETEYIYIPPQRPYNREDYCDYNPEFAVICSFIAKFGDKIDLSLDIEQLKSQIEDQDNLNDSLIDLHVKLLKKIRRYFVRDQWEKALIRFALEYSYEDAYEIEQYSYQKTRPSVKLELLRRLLDAQFECDQKFKSLVNTCEAEDLRLNPTGRDIKGNTYWYQSDNEGNFRVFSEEPLDHRSWTTICKTPDELSQLIDNLDRTKDDRVKNERPAEFYDPLPEIFPEYFQVEEKKVEQIQETKKTNGKRSTKKGKGRGRAKKSSLLEPLAEVNEETIDKKPSTIDNCIIKNELVSTDDIHAKPFHNERKLSLSGEIDSIESQVSSTLENILTKVVTKLGNFFRPISMNLTKDNEFRQESLQDVKPAKKRQPKKEKVKIEELPRRSSSRIQQLQQKKEEELKKMIESKIDESSSNSLLESKIRNQRGSTKPRGSESPDSGHLKGKRRKKDAQRWRQGKNRKKLSWDKDDSDLSSTSSLTVTDEDEDFDLNGNEKFQFDNNNLEDEFACEDEETNNEPVIIKRARTARQVIEDLDQTGDLNTSSIIEEDKPCGRCDKSNDPEWILLCDMCDDGYHTSCCMPPLMEVPDGDWFCPPCEHKMLLTKLKEYNEIIKELYAVKERERLKKQKLRQRTAKKEVKNIPPAAENNPPEKRRRDYLHDLNEPIALQQLDDEISVDELPKSYKERASRPKKKSRRRRTYEDDDLDDEDEIVMNVGKRKHSKSRRKRYDSDESEIEEKFVQESSESSEEEEEDDVPKARRARARVTNYRFQEYDELIKSAIQADSDADMAHEDEDENEEDEEESDENSGRGNYGRGKDMATIEALAYQQENGLLEMPITQNDQASPTQQKKRREPKKKSPRLNDLDADSEIDVGTSDESFQASSAAEEEEEEEEDEDDLTEVDSEEESSLDEIIPSKFRKKGKVKKRRNSYESDDDEDDDYAPRSKRRAAQRVSYKESTDEDDEDFLVDPSKKVKKVILSSDAETEASWVESNKSDCSDEIQHDDQPEMILEDGPCSESFDDEVAMKPKCSQPDSLGTPPPRPFYPEDEVKPSLPNGQCYQD